MSNQIEIAKKIDGVVLSVIGKKGLAGFEKAHIVSSAIGELKILLDDKYMKPIMELQGTALGFKTDKDLQRNPSGKGYIKGDGYPVEVVRNVLIEAVLKGYQPTNNEFNIIGGNMYPAKNGLKRKLDEIPGLEYTIIHSIKSWSVEKGNASFDTKIKWNNCGKIGEETVPLITKIDAYSSTDAAIGKADRKAYAWLLGKITGEIVVDGEVEDADFKDITNSAQVALPKVPDFETLQDLIKAGNSVSDLQAQYEIPEDQVKNLMQIEMNFNQEG